MLDPIVHAALVVVATWLINLLFTYLNIDLGGELVTQLATLLVGYILSLFGYSLWANATNKTSLAATRTYKPPFTS